MGTQLHEVSKQWSSRPDDQRFLSLADLKSSVLQRKRESWTATPQLPRKAAPGLSGHSY
jgi:hypothetical protein